MTRAVRPAQRRFAAFDRLRRLRSPGQDTSLRLRSPLLPIAFVVFLGTFYPLITDALGEKRALGPPWFDDYIVPFVLVLVLLSGIGPVIRLKER